MTSICLCWLLKAHCVTFTSIWLQLHILQMRPKKPTFPCWLVAQNKIIGTESILETGNKWCQFINNIMTAVKHVCFLCLELCPWAIKKINCNPFGRLDDPRCKKQIPASSLLQSDSVRFGSFGLRSVSPTRRRVGDTYSASGQLDRRSTLGLKTFSS